LVDGPGKDALRGTRGHDIFNVRRGADAVIGGYGNDNIVLYRDSNADLVKCGPGNDSLAYTGKRERHDVFRGCETVAAYQP
jgi:Ca2+-binding RTX toxin-like protein